VKKKARCSHGAFCPSSLREVQPLEHTSDRGTEPQTSRLRRKVNGGKPDEAFEAAQLKLTKPTKHPLKPITQSSCTPRWQYGDGKSFTLYENDQAVMNHQRVMKQVLGVPLENVRVVSRSSRGGLAASFGHGPIPASLRPRRES